MPIYVISTVPCNRGTPTPQSGDGYGLKRGSEMVKVPGGEGAVLGLMRDW